MTGASAMVHKCSSAHEWGDRSGILLSLAFGAAHVGRNAAYVGLKRVFADPRKWGTVRSQWSKAAGGLQPKGQSLHHWLIPQRWGQFNAGLNYLPLGAGRNSWMGRTALRRIFVEGAFRAAGLGIYGAPGTSAAKSALGCRCD
jgi:hypothetical protein